MVRRKPRLVPTNQLLGWPIIGAVVGGGIGYWRGRARDKKLLYTLSGVAIGGGAGFGARYGIHKYGKAKGWPKRWAIVGG